MNDSLPLMDKAQQEAILTICLMAAFADGVNSDAERTELKRIVSALGGEGMDLARLNSSVLLQNPSIEGIASSLDNPRLRNLAYELALCICEADNDLSAAEKEFLQLLRCELKIEAAPAAIVPQQPGSLMTISLEDPEPPVVPALARVQQSPVDDAALEQSILNYSILNASLELLPQSISTIAIIPLQIKMVHGIGQRYGYELDRGHIRELLATLGVGITSQVIEGSVLKLIGGLLGKFLGHGMAHAVADQTASSMIAFATTYALGHAARRYYAGGRTTSAVDLKSIFGSLLDNAKSLHARYMPQIQERAGSLDIMKLLPMIRQQSL